MLSLIRRYPYLLGFCVLSAAASGPGQTYFISLIIPRLRDDFELSRSAIGALYSIGTILSACMVPMLGKLLDRAPLRLVSAAATLGVAGGLILLGSANGALALLAAFTLLRFFGQSGQSLQATTTAARLFSKTRGKALGITSLGWPLAEMTLPFVLALLIGSLEWRHGVIAFAALYAAFMLTAGQTLLALSPTGAGAQPASEPNSKIKSWTAGEVFRDSRVYFILAVTFVPPFLNTGIFFHQGTLASIKGWSAAAIPAGFFAYGLFRGLAALSIGPIIDRLSARALFGFQLLPTILGTLILAYGFHPLTAIFGFGFIGMAVGLTGPIRGALFAEIYGVKHLGAINGFGAAWAVFATAVAPFTFGFALDCGVSWPALMFSLAALTAVSIALGRFGCRSATIAGGQKASS